MRKDAKIGLAIGGVLLAVLIAYITVVPKRHSAIAPNAVSLAIPPAAPAESAVAPADQATADKPSDTKPDATAHNDAVNWEKLLGVNNADAPQPLGNTTTPAGASPAPAPTAHAADNPAPAPAAEAPVAAANTAPAVSFTPTPTAPAAPTRTVEPFTGPRTYVVKSGQTLSSIAADVYGNQRFYVAILRANPNLNPKQLQPGMKITLPDISDVRPDSSTAMAAASSTEDRSGHTYTVKSGDTLYRISQKLFGTPRQAEAIYDLNRDTIGPDEAKLRLGMVLKLPESAVSGATASSR